MKGRQGSPVKSSPRKGAQEKASPAGGGSPKKAHGESQASGKRKLVYRYRQNQQGAVGTASPSVSVLEAAKVVMKQNMANSTAGEGEDSKLQRGRQNEVATSAGTALGESKVGKKIGNSSVSNALKTATGRKVVKSIVGQSYIQEVLTDNGEFLNFRCKLCKVRFTDLQEIHVRGRRHRLNLAAKEGNSASSASLAFAQPVQGNDAKPNLAKKKVVGQSSKPVKKKATVPRKTPTTSDKINLIRSSNIADVLNQERKKENFTIYQLYKEMRESCVISDRWCIPEPLWDPCTNREVLLCYETDVLMDGTVRMKRCLKVLDNFELVVLLDSVDKTHIFKEKHPTIQSLQEMLDLIRKVTMVKVCNGVKDCDPAELENIATKVIQKGGSWYSTECNVEVERGCLGNICKKCTSLRNTLRRRLRRQFGLDSTNATPTASRNLLSNTMKPVLRTVGEALYLNLRHMSGINRVPSEEGPPPPRGENQVLHPELGIFMNQELKERLDEVAANPPPPITKIEHIVEFDPRTMTKTLKRIHTPVAPNTFRGTLGGSIAGQRALGIGAAKRLKTDSGPNNQSFVLGNSGELTLVQTPNGETIQLPEGYVLADDSQQQWSDGNIVIQKLPDGQEQQDQFILGDDNSIIQVGGLASGGNFTLEDGEEYEVIGEAPAGVDGDALQVLPLGGNSDIEIIEVDENMIQLVDENSQPEIQPVDSNSDIFKFLQAQARLQGM